VGRTRAHTRGAPQVEQLGADGPQVTATTRQLATFTLDHLQLGIEVTRVQEVIGALPMSTVPQAPPVVRGLINLRGQIVTALDLRRKLGLPERAGQHAGMNVVVRDGEGAVALLVDGVGDVVEVSEESFAPAPATLRAELRRLLRGAWTLPDMLLLDLDVDRALEPEVRS
jgi:purine-binding chemotaxis protein CheW